MRRIAFAIALLGIFFLFLLGEVMPGIEIRKPDDLENLSENQKIVFKGVVDVSNNYGSYTLLEVKGMRVFCEGCSVNLNGKSVIIEGVIMDYNDKKEIGVLGINILD